MEPDVEFFGVAIPPGKTIHCSEADPEEDGEDGGGADETSLVHVTQFALGPSPAPGRHTILAVRSNGSEFAVGTLEAGRVDQFSADFMWSALAPSPADGISDGGGYGAVSFRHTGASAVHLTGYKTVSSLLDYGGMSEGEEEEEESGSEEEEEAGADGHRRHQAARPRPRGLVRLGAPEAESDEEDEEDDDDDSSALSEDDEEDEDSLLTSSGSEEEDEEEAPRAVPLKAGRARAAAPLRKGEPAGLELSSDDGEEDEDDEDWTEEEDEDEEGLAEEEAAAAAALGGGGGGSSEEEEAAAAVAGRRAVPPTAAKRPAPAPASPAPAKKGKAAPAAAPANPPTPAMAAAGGGGGSAAAYAAALASHLRAAGPTRVANLGSAVPRPPAAPKLMKVLTGMGDLFAVDGAGMVSLKKQ